MASLLLWLLAPAASAQPEPTASPLPALQAERLAQLETQGLSSAAQRAIAASLARWQALGPLPEGRWLLVNVPAYEIRLLDGPAKLGSWRAIVGKTKTPTPMFTAEAKGVILNPSWDIPASIVAESVGRMVARRPAEAARKGYVRDGDRYRQQPGPNNELGQMKLDFSNAYSIGIHDTPIRSAFQREKRALSHGCIRVDDPFGFAAALLGPPTSTDSLKTVVDVSPETRTLPFDQPIPVIIGYFTAEVGDDGKLLVYDDIYRKDGAAMAAAPTPQRPENCAR